MLGIGKAGGLLTKHLLADVAMEEGVGDVKLVSRPVLGGDDGEHCPNLRRLNYQREGFPESMRSADESHEGPNELYNARVCR